MLSKFIVALASIPLPSTDVTVPSPKRSWFTPLSYREVCFTAFDAAAEAAPTGRSF